jgi:hypothetical protein
MGHYYEFFDRELFDSLWARSWQQFQRQCGSRWAKRKAYEQGAYYGDSLRGLLAFSIDPEPSPELLEEVLTRRTIRWTVQHSDPQFYVMSEIMHHVPGHQAGLCCLEDVPGEDVGVFISAVIHGYFAGKIGIPTLQAIFKLHSCTDPDEWLSLSTQAKRTLKSMGSVVDFSKPIYAWQGESAVVGEEWANCLAVAGTRRLASFIVRAWDEDWPIRDLRVMPQEVRQHRPEGFHFRDFKISGTLRKAILKIQRYKRPSVYRRWC